MGTVTCPADQIARSARNHHAQFFEKIAMREPRGRSRERRCAAMRRTSPMASRHVKSRTPPPPSGCVSHTRSPSFVSFSYAAVSWVFTRTEYPEAVGMNTGVFDPELRSNPFARYRGLREQNPVVWDDGVPGGAWVFSRYADVLRGLKDPRLSGDR